MDQPPLIRYWFRFKAPRFPKALDLGCGVSAHSYEDAVNLVRERIFGGKEPDIIACEIDVDISKLDGRHVLPNIGSMAVRGIWFPLGFR